MSELLPEREVEQGNNVKDPRRIGAEALDAEGFRLPESDSERYAARVGDYITYESETGVDTIILVQPGEALDDDDAVTITSPLGRELEGAVAGVVITWKRPQGIGTAVVRNVTPGTVTDSTQSISG